MGPVIHRTEPPPIDPIVNTLVQLPVGVGALVVLYLSFRAFRAEMHRERSLRRKSHRMVMKRLKAIDAKLPPDHPKESPPCVPPWPAVP
jgi:hypothetical protein